MDKLEAVADRGYFDGRDISPEGAGVAVTSPKPMTSNGNAEGRSANRTLPTCPDEDVYRSPSRQQLPITTYLEHETTLHRYWPAAACQGCAIKGQDTSSKERHITR